MSKTPHGNANKPRQAAHRELTRKFPTGELLPAPLFAAERLGISLL